MRATSRILSVEGRSQRDNKHFPSSTCNTTAVAVVASFYGVKSLLPGVQLEDILTEMTMEPWAKKLAVECEGKKYENSPRLVWKVLENLIERFPSKIDHADIEKLTLDQICDHLDAGRPLIIGGNFPCGNTTIGHFQVISGYEKSGDVFIVQDSWGDPTTKYENTDGTNVRISRADAQKWWRDAGSGTKLAIVAYKVNA